MGQSVTTKISSQISFKNLLFFDCYFLTFIFLVPLITGMKRLPEGNLSPEWGDPLVIDLNRKRVFLPSKENFPELPKIKQLTNEITKLYSDFQAKSKNLSRKVHFEIEFVDNVREAFRKHNTFLLDNDLFLLICDPSKEAVKKVSIDDSAFKLFPKKHQLFMKRLSETQQFSVHALQIKLDIDEQDSQFGMTLNKLDEMIVEANEAKKKLLLQIQEANVELRAVEARLSTLQASKAKLREDATHINPLHSTLSPARKSHRRNKSVFG